MNKSKFLTWSRGCNANRKKLATRSAPNTAKKSLCIIVCSCLAIVTAGAQTIVENFEYGSDSALQSAWTSQSASLTLSSYRHVASTGTNSMRVDRFFPANAGETEILTGPALATPIAIQTNHYLCLRIAGDPQFTNASMQRLYLYAFDGSGNFGRWGAPVPLSTKWQTLTFPAAGIQKPAESPALPDLENIAQFKFYLVGQGDPAGVAYPATIYLDDLRIFPAPMLSFVQQGANQRVLMKDLVPGILYTLQQTTNLTRPVTVSYTFTANSTSQTWNVPKGQQAFYKLVFAP